MPRLWLPTTLDSMEMAEVGSRVVTPMKLTSDMLPKVLLLMITLESALRRFKTWIETFGRGAVRFVFWRVKRRGEDTDSTTILGIPSQPAVTVDDMTVRVPPPVSTTCPPECTWHRVRLWVPPGDHRGDVLVNAVVPPDKHHWDEQSQQHNVAYCASHRCEWHCLSYCLILFKDKVGDTRRINIKLENNHVHSRAQNKSRDIHCLKME